jgi:cupin 2 domain-containing protein
MNTVPTGRYRHYKGKHYSVLEVARHSETLEELVVYRQEYGDRGLWVRPKQMFLETVDVAGKQVPRFEYLGSEPTDGESSQCETACGNLLADLPEDMPAELVETILRRPGIRIEKIVSRGHASPEGFWYDQPQHEFVLLVCGGARLRLDGDHDPVEMKPGDFIEIPAHRRHRVDATDPNQPTVWLAIHFSE